MGVGVANDLVDHVTVGGDWNDDDGQNVTTDASDNQSDPIERDDDSYAVEAETELHGMENDDDETDIGDGTDDAAVPPPSGKIADGEDGIRNATADDQVENDIVVTTTTKKVAKSCPHSTMDGE